MPDFYAVIREGLQKKLGCVLFQLPPRLSFTGERKVQNAGVTRHSFIYFNNDIGGSAIENATEIQSYGKATS